MSDKNPYPFNPFVDSLIGEKILFVWKAGHHDEAKLSDSLKKNLGLDLFFFTPNANKQTLMVRYPTMVRDFLNKSEYDEVGKLLINISKGNLDELQNPALDISFELMEWLLTGFDLDEQLANYLILHFGHSDVIDVSFVNSVRTEYIKEMRE